jgi:hypothetical protein
MKLLFGMLGAVLMTVFLGSIVLKVKEPALVAVVLVGLLLMLVDLWQARNEKDT